MYAVASEFLSLALTYFLITVLVAALVLLGTIFTLFIALGGRVNKWKVGWQDDSMSYSRGEIEGKAQRRKAVNLRSVLFLCGKACITMARGENVERCGRTNTVQRIEETHQLSSYQMDGESASKA